MLAAIGYSGLAGHKLLHQEFRQMLRDLLDEARRLTLDEIADCIEDLINGWFYQHILTVDADYVDAVKASRKPPVPGA
jgi:hemerythrin